ncbi:MAG TPA: site-2 protease family protein, partial [Actinomycetota bacterium]|nr:site-2 protease family protein [Actinomycetota bacterium]
DGEAVDYDTFAAAVDENVGRPISITVRRGGSEVTVEATPVLAEVEGEETGRLGISYRQGGVLARHRLSPIEALGGSAAGVGELVVASFRAMGRVFGPEGLGRIGEVLVGGRERSLNDPVGVVGAARVAGQAVQAGFFDVFLQLFAVFNVFVGLLNLMPLPPLDGGHLAVLGFEAVTRRPVDPRRLVPLTALVAGFLVLFTVALLYIDIANPLPNIFQ